MADDRRMHVALHLGIAQQFLLELLGIENRTEARAQFVQPGLAWHQQRRLVGNQLADVAALGLELLQRCIGNGNADHVEILGRRQGKALLALESKHAVHVDLLFAEQAGAAHRNGNADDVAVLPRGAILEH
ncbi:hypothetical protein [Dechloromonas sp. A34]|uniref:hypothetical protein n=1 Tax=Dechloromonas sp. A34 TaxID=447588 RepID=UPI00224913C8|nr:hypothetical protein [Dechloromonas sp. A34]